MHKPKHIYLKEKKNWFDNLINNKKNSHWCKKVVHSNNKKNIHRKREKKKKKINREYWLFCYGYNLQELSERGGNVVIQNLYEKQDRKGRVEGDERLDKVKL